MTTRAEFVAVARSYLRTPYGHQGRLPGVLLDCVGVPICAARETGLKPAAFDITGYGREPDGRLLPLCREHMVEIAQAEMQAGDVIVVHQGENPRHMGVLWDYAPGKLGIVHAIADGGKRRGEVREHRLVFGPLCRFVAAFRVPGIV